MARLGRSQPGYRSGHSTLGPPRVVGPAVVFRPVEVSLAARARRDSDIRRVPLSVLRPPTVVEVPQPFIAAPVAVSLVPNHTPDEIRDGRRRSSYDIAAPVVVFPKDGFGQTGVALADSRNARSDGRRLPHSYLRPPEVVAPAAEPFTAETVRITQAEPHRPAVLTHSLVRSPVVVGPVVTYGPVQVALAESHRPAPTYPRLYPPAVVGPVVTYGPIEIEFAKVRQSRPTGHARLAPPTVVGPAEIYRPVQVALVEARKPRLVHPRLAQPAVVAQPVPPPVQTTVRVTRAASGDPRRHFAKSELRTPTIVGPAIVYPGPRVELAEPHRPPAVRSRLAPPAPFVIAAPPPVETTVDVTLTPSRDVPRRLPKSVLQAPVVVGPAVVYRSVAISLAPQPRQARAAHSKLRAPQVVSEQFFARAPLVSLVPSSNLTRRSHPKLRAPSVVGPVVVHPSIDTKLAPQPRQGRATHIRLRPPTVVFPFVAPTITVNLRVTGQEIGPRRPVHPRLRLPTVVTALSDVIYLDYYDHPEPKGIPSSSPREGDWDAAESGGNMSSSPGTGAFDIPKPIGEMD